MKSAKGFTLVELMIAVVIVSIIAAIAMPAYSNYTQRGKIAEATSNLAGLRVGMEQYYQDNRNYGSTAAACGIAMPGSPQVKYFNFSCNWTVASPPNATTGGTNQFYTITANGIGSMAGFTYTIDQNNNQQTTAAPGGWAAAAMPTNCWITKQGGAC